MDGISESGESIQLVRAMINPNVTIQEIEAKKYRPPMAEKHQNNLRDFVDEEELERHSVAGQSDYSRANEPRARATEEPPDDEEEMLADKLYKKILGETGADRENALRRQDAPGKKYSGDTDLGGKLYASPIEGRRGVGSHGGTGVETNRREPDRRGRTGGDDKREHDRRGRTGGDDEREHDRRGRTGGDDEREHDRRGRTGGDDEREHDRRGRAGGDDEREHDRRSRTGGDEGRESKERLEEEPNGWFSRGFDEIPESGPRGLTGGRDEYRSGGRDEYRSGGRDEYRSGGRDEYRSGGRDEYRGEKKIEFSEGDILRSKHTMLIELNALEGQGAKLTKKYTMYDPVDDIHFELLRQQNIVDCLTTVDYWIMYIVASMFVIEWINYKLGAPLYFTGVGEYMQGNMENVRVPLQKCYHRYVHRSTSSPVWDVVKALGASLFTYHMENMLMGGSVNKKEKGGKKEAGAGSGRGSTAASSSIFSFLPMMMKSFGGGGAAKSAPAARSGGSHTPFSPSVPGDMQMPPDFFGAS